MLNLVWAAYLKSGKIIRQFDDEEQTQEHLFKEVQFLHDQVAVFTLINIRTNRVYQVNLECGRIHIFNPGFVISPEAEVTGDSTQNYRLIYFRRVTQNMACNLSEGMTMMEPDVQYFLGYQYTTEDGKNVKRMIQITSQDEVYLT